MAVGMGKPKLCHWVWEKRREHRKQKYLFTNPIWALVREMTAWQAEEKILLSIRRIVRTKKNPVCPFPLPCVLTHPALGFCCNSVFTLCRLYSFDLGGLLFFECFFPWRIKSPRVSTSKVLCIPLQNRCYYIMYII